MPSPKINKILNIEYQLLKQYDIADFTDSQLVYFAQNLLNALIDETDIIVDSDMPTFLLGTTLDWSEGPTTNDKIVRISRGSVSIAQDLTVKNIAVPGLDLSQDFIAVLNIIKMINGETSVPDVGYTETDLTAILSDAYDVMLQINGNQPTKG